MEILKFDTSKTYGSFKILNATNGGPWHKRHATDQYRSNFEAYRAARIPYSRNHDSGVVGIYGGPYSHDITNIFPDFNADETDPASYDFACTDESILATLEAGTETFFRLGQTIEHQIKKHGTLPPKDFNKWARICEHIIKHYNYGWADGFNLNIQYWEIWNEPNLDPDDGTHKRCWGGTKAEFFEFYATAAKHLKNCFPELKIGGPAFAGEVEETGKEKYIDEFLAYMEERDIPLDFCSWHLYETEPYKILNLGRKVKNLLIKHGYTETESICNEWNYVRGWTEDFVYSIKAITSLKGAAFMMAFMSEAQKSEVVDMLMYYDTRPSPFCGVFDFYTYETLKGYYPLYWYGKFYDLESEIRCENEPENIYTLAGVDKNGKDMAIITNYSEDDNAPEKEIKLDFGKEGKYEIYRVDNELDGELVATTENLEFMLPVHSFVIVKEV